MTERQFARRGQTFSRTPEHGLVQVVTLAFRGPSDADIYRPAIPVSSVEVWVGVVLEYVNWFDARRVNPAYRTEEALKSWRIPDPDIGACHFRLLASRSDGVSPFGLELDGDTDRLTQRVWACLRDPGLTTLDGLRSEAAVIDHVDRGRPLPGENLWFSYYAAGVLCDRVQDFDRAKAFFARSIGASNRASWASRVRAAELRLGLYDDPYWGPEFGDGRRVP